MLFERTDLTNGGTRRRGVSTSYGNRRPQRFGVPPGALSFGVTSNNNLDVASGKTLFLSSPTSEEGGNLSSAQNLDGNQEDDQSKVQHTTPIVGQKKLLASHKNIMKNNVAKFIKDHNLGTRHFQNRQLTGDANSHTTAVDDPTNLGSDNVSWMNSRTGGISLKAHTTGRNQSSGAGTGGNQAHPKSQMLNLSFKKYLDTNNN